MDPRRPCPRTVGQVVGSTSTPQARASAVADAAHVAPASPYPCHAVSWLIRHVAPRPASRYTCAEQQYAPCFTVVDIVLAGE